MDILERLMALRDRWEANEARKAFEAAVADAKAEIRPILKDRLVDYPNRNSNGRTTYRHESLAAIAREVDPILGKYGLSYRHEPEQLPGKMLRVTCILSHRAGHSTRTMLEGPYDESGNKNALQGVGSTGSYLQRYTLRLALGLAISDDPAVDDDGRAGGGEVVTITTEQVQALEEEIRRLGADRTGFMRALRLDNLGDMRAENYEKALEFLRTKKATGKGGTAPPRRKSDQQQATQTAGAAATYKAEALAMLRQKIDSTGVPEGEVLERYTATTLEELTLEQIDDAIAWLARIV
jgi:hypothetical protein